MLVWSIYSTCARWQPDVSSTARLGDQLQHSSTNLPSLSIISTYAFAESALSPPYVSAAYASALRTAAGILFEDLRRRKLSAQGSLHRERSLTR